MPVTISGLYEVTLFQDDGGNEMLNVFWYWEEGGANGLADTLASLFDVNVLPEIAAIQNVGIDYLNIRVQPVFGTGIEANRTPSTPAGLVVGTAMNMAYCISFRLFRSTNETRSGWKRFSGIVEENTKRNSFEAPYLALAASLSLAMRLNLVAAADTFRPVIVRKPFSTKDLSPDWLRNEISVAVAVDRPTTQVSRKLF